MKRNRRVVLKKGTGLFRKWYFVYQSANNRIVATSQVYLTKARARKSAKAHAIVTGADYIERV